FGTGCITGSGYVCRRNRFWWVAPFDRLSDFVVRLLVMRSVSKRVQLSHLKRGAAEAALLTMTRLSASLLPGAAWAEEAAAPTEAAIVQNEVQDALGEADEALTGTEAGDAQPESRAEGRRDKDCKAWWDHKPWRGPGYDPCDQKDRKYHK